MKRKLSLSNVRKRLAALELQLQQESKALREKIQTIKDRCPHNDVYFVPDPSGNNDSEWKCPTCGQFFGNNPT